MLAPEWVAVPHPGMARWLSLALAERLGVAANVRFPLPAAFIWHLLRTAVPALPDRSAFEPRVLKWAILARLDEVAEPGGTLGHYLAGADALMRYELAVRIALSFDRYLVYRPHWIRGWEREAASAPAETVSAPVETPPRVPAPSATLGSSPGSRAKTRARNDGMANTHWIAALT